MEDFGFWGLGIRGLAFSQSSALSKHAPIRLNPLPLEWGDAEGGVELATPDGGRGIIGQVDIGGDGVALRTFCALEGGQHPVVAFAKWVGRGCAGAEDVGGTVQHYHEVGTAVGFEAVAKFQEGLAPVLNHLYFALGGVFAIHEHARPQHGFGLGLGDGAGGGGAGTGCSGGFRGGGGGGLARTTDGQHCR